MLSSRLFLVTIALAALSEDLSGQAPGSTARFTGSSFVFVRYKYEGAISAYASRRIGSGMAFAGVIENPYTSSRTVILGSGTRVRFGAPASIATFLGGAASTDGWSLRTYLLPRFKAGRIAGGGTISATEPLSGSVRRQLSIDPLTLSLRTVERARVGVATRLQAKEGSVPRWGAGPSLELRAFRSAFAVEGISAGWRRPFELQASISATF